MAIHSYVVIFCVIYLILCLSQNINASLNHHQSLDTPGWKNNINFNIFEQKKVILKVYYESLCPASVEFFTEQLTPAVEALGSHMEVILIPYGNAEMKRSRGSFRFSCQHGPDECYGNKLHACAVDILKNNKKAVFYNTCLLKYSRNSQNFSIDFTTALNWCGYKYSVPIRRVRNCARSKRGSVLLRRYGEETHQMDIKYVPYVLLAGSSDMQDQAAANLTATVCQMLGRAPPVCRLYTNRRRPHRMFV